MKNTAARKQMTWNETLAFRAALEGVNTLSATQLAKAYEICGEFGEVFAGILDRADSVRHQIIAHETCGTSGVLRVCGRQSKSCCTA
jgi:hypothetical protein